MTGIVLTGRARRFGDDVNTDYIISSTRKRDTLDETVLARYLFEAVDKSFASSVRAGDLIVAGRNFGCGSAMEVAATVILAAGIRGVLARTFSRTFYRNAINNGLLPIECDTAAIVEGDPLTVRIEGDRIDVRNASSGLAVPAHALPRVMLDIYTAGGLVNYLREHGGFLDA